MKMSRKTIALCVLTTFVVAGTALAAVRTTTTTKSVTIDSNSGPDITVSTTTTDTVSDNSRGKTVVIAQTSPEAELANILFRILGIPVSVQEVTVLKTRNLGYGEIALVYNLAHASGRSVDDILIMRFDHKMGWGKIAKSLGVKLHGPADQSVVILREAKLDKDADDFSISIKVDLDDDDKDEVKDKKSNHDHPQKLSKDNDNDDHGKGKGPKKH